MDNEKQLLIKMSIEHKSILETMSTTVMNVKRLPKPACRSEEVRKAGNQLFMQKDHDAETHREIFEHYCKSISLAPLQSEILALAYGNRSAFLLHVHKYDDCMRDIDGALKITKSDLLRIKLLCRKVECMKQLGLPNYQAVLEAAEGCAKKVDKSYNTQVAKFIDKAKTCYISNEKVSKNQSVSPNNMSPQVDQTLECISIEHNEKYGRHLIAMKDYKPGDFIFQDDLYVTVLNPSMNYINCNYCLKICWSGIACDYCSWAMFCSEDCRKKAWDTFHDIECPLIFYLRNSLSELFDSMQVSLRMLLVGIREAGSIIKLREDLKLVDQCTDIRYKGFYKNGLFQSCTIQSLYSLKSFGIPEFNLKGIASAALMVLIAIVKHTQLIRNFKFENIEDITANEDLVFLGSLLIKLTTIKSNNAHSFSQKSCFCERLKPPSDQYSNKCCERGCCLTTLCSLTNHSCDPNASMIFSEDKKITIYALQPIKKNSQIFTSYAGFYHSRSMTERKNYFIKYDFTCECRACIESWPILFISPELSPTGQSVQERKLAFDCMSILAALDAKKMNFKKKDIKKLCETIVKAKKLPQPNVLSATLENALVEIYSRVYGWEPLLYAFGRCNKV